MPTPLHNCHAHGCTVRVQERRFMCWTHWSKLPGGVQNAIWREYRPGQERDKNPSVRYLAVQRFAIAHTAFVPNDEEAAKTAAVYLGEAVRWRQHAIGQGLGDPLEGLVST